MELDMDQVGYTLDDGTVVSFELDPGVGFQPAGGDGIAGKLADAVAPVVAGAKVLLDKAREAKPDEVAVQFAVKVTGGANWLIARSTVEGNFQVTLTWRSEQNKS